MSKDLVTVAQLAQVTGADYFALRRAAEKVTPELRLNSLPYFSEEQAKQILRMAQEQTGKAPNREAVSA